MSRGYSNGVRQTTIRPTQPADAPAIADIYNFYIRTSHATFEMDEIDAVEMHRRIEEAAAANYPFLVAEEASELIGYAYGRRYRPRAAYEHSIEISVYIRNGHEGRGVAAALYDELLPAIRQRGFHTIIAGISLPNDASVRLHEKFGMTKVAHFREVGRKFDRWIDVGYWQVVY
jgi:phosphinothricin acetyltransferase